MWFAIPVMDWVLSRFSYCNFLILISAAVAVDIWSDPILFQGGGRKGILSELWPNPVLWHMVWMTHGPSVSLLVRFLPKCTYLHVHYLGCVTGQLRCSIVWIWSYGEPDKKKQSHPKKHMLIHTLAQSEHLNAMFACITSSYLNPPTPHTQTQTSTHIHLYGAN